MVLVDLVDASLLSDQMGTNDIPMSPFLFRKEITRAESLNEKGGITVKNPDSSRLNTDKLARTPWSRKTLNGRPITHIGQLRKAY